MKSEVHWKSYCNNYKIKLNSYREQFTVWTIDTDSITNFIKKNVPLVVLYKRDA